MKELANINDVSIFAKQVGSRFRIEIDTHHFVTTKLIEADPLGSRSRSSELPASEPFSLLFKVDGHGDLPQKTYRIHHETLGELMLFLVPVGNGKLESTFN